MATATGHFGSFNPSVETWTAYTARLGHYFIANGISNVDKKRSTLLTVCGPATYQLICDLLSPTNPTEKNFDELVDLVKKHQDPAPSEILQRYHFFTRVQKPDESINDYVAQLRKLAHHCNFGDTLEIMLRDRLVCGCRDRRLQYKLLSDPQLTFKKALTTAQSDEIAERGTKDISGPTGSTNKLNAHRPRRPRPATAPPKPPQTPTQPCSRCGALHSPTTCRFKSATCHYCKKQGHLASVCRKKARDQTGKTSKSSSKNHKLEVDSSDAEDVEPHPLFYSTTSRPKPIKVTVTLNNVDTPMEVDTGATLSVMSEATYSSLWKADVRPDLEPSSARLSTYTGERISVLGQITLNVSYQKQNHRLSIQVVPGKGPTLLGRDWLEKIQLNWHGIHQLCTPPTISVQQVLDRYPAVFNGKLGQIASASTPLHVDPSQQPRFFKARPVPYSLRTKVEAELTRLQEEGVIKPVTVSEWAAPIVPVVKRDGTIRICGDYKLTVNAVSKTDPYPLPRIDDIFASLSGGKAFTKLHLAHAYQQVPLTEEAQKYTTVNTHKGLFQYLRLPFGIASAPGIFQRTMETILQDIPHVCVYLDDILVTGPTEEQHLATLEEVLRRLNTAGIRLKRQKCAFMLPSIEYLGHRISADGLQPTDSKVKALKQAPVPANVSQLKSFLGLLNYYGKFVPNLSTVLAPLHSLLHKRATWTWGTEQQSAFDKVKNLLTSDIVLAHYDQTKPVILACDASPYGIGAVLSHSLPDGSERPIAYASRTLGPAEKRYSQLDKEGLAIVFGVKRFHQYLAGRHFTILSDHKPLQHLFQEDKGIPSMASARIQRWALILGAYDYSIRYKPGQAHSNADVLSRLPLPDTPPKEHPPGEITHSIHLLQSLPVTAKDVRTWTGRDPTLSKVRTMLTSGWTDTKDSALKPFVHRQDELSLEDGCILWGSRVVVPTQGRTKVLDELHQGHPGIARMKALARSFVWWPGIDKDLENRVKQCSACQKTQHLPATAPIQPWEFPKRPWSRLHIDYAGPINGLMFLVVVDAHSKWMEVHTTKQANSKNTITILQSIFTTHGLPELLVSDNGTPFTSQEFHSFTKALGIRHNTSAPYHPATNGLAERAVQTFKQFLRKSSDGPLEEKLQQFLFQYRITPHSTTGSSPAQLLFGRQLRSRLDLLRPDLHSRVQQRQEQQKANKDNKARPRSLSVGDPVLVADLPSKDTWLPATVVRTLGSRTYELKLSDNRIIRRHIDHIRNRHHTESNSEASSRPNTDIQTDWVPTPPEYSDQETPPTPPSPPENPPPPRRSARISRPPERLIDQLNS